MNEKLLKDIEEAIKENKRLEKEKELKNGINEWILFYTIFYIFWITVNLCVGLVKNDSITSNVENINISLKDYFIINACLQFPIYLCIIFDVIYINLPLYKHTTLLGEFIMISFERIIFLIIHFIIIALVFTAIIISSKLSFMNDKLIIFGLIFMFVFQILISLISIGSMGWVSKNFTLHDVIKKINLYDTNPTLDELYEEYYKQII